MSLSIYNSQSQTKEVFQSIQPNKVSMYVCGPTVYNYLHVGNFRGVVFFNLVRHWLEYLGYQVEYLLNFTDVDDKIIQKAKAEGVDSYQLSEKYIAEYKKDFASLGLTPHEKNPKVTEHIDAIISMVQKLISENKAYVAGGDVLYAIESFSDYGKLSGRDPEQLLKGVRIEVDVKKKNPLDFVLWKAAKSGEPSWSSPWGEGRPGWHIECSAMIQHHFGHQIDIHGGGMDLIFPHHENEIAQSEGCSGQHFVKYWMHNNMLNFDGQKMSKSIGNIITLREFLSQYPAEVYKWMMLSVHYRSVCDFGETAVLRSLSGLARIYSALALAEEYLADGKTCNPALLSSSDLFSLVGESHRNGFADAWKTIEEKMNDDFSTPEVWAVVFEQVRLFNGSVKRGINGKALPAAQEKSLGLWILLKKLGSLMSLFQNPARAFLTSLDDLLLAQKNLQRAEIDQLVMQRWEARKNKDFTAADSLRLRLKDLGIQVSDTPNGSYWEVEK